MASIARFFVKLSTRSRANQPHRCPAGWHSLGDAARDRTCRTRQVRRCLPCLGSCPRPRSRAEDPLVHRGDVATDTHVVEEGRLMARVRHPNVVTIYGAQRIGWRHRPLDGVRRRAHVSSRTGRARAVQAEELARVGIELCRALGAVHEAGLLHRDVKAQNVLRDEGGRILLGDFGTGRELEVSSSGSLAGTPTHLAPELFEGSPHHRKAISTVSALCCSIWRPERTRCRADRCATCAMRMRMVAGRHSAALRPDLPKRLVHVIETALDADPARRFKSAKAMAHALERVLGASPPPLHCCCRYGHDSRGCGICHDMDDPARRRPCRFPSPNETGCS